MTLEFADGLMRGDGFDDISAFTIEGEYRVEGEDVRLGWIKTYEEAHSVLYLGTMRRDRVVGKWDLHGWSGAFVIRPVTAGNIKPPGASSS